MLDYKKIFDAITSDPRYQSNLDWGVVRPGHPEGTIRAHIAELERNLERLRPKVLEADYWRLKVLVHTHDTFKGEAQPGAPIMAPTVTLHWRGHFSPSTATTPTCWRWFSTTTSHSRCGVSSWPRADSRKSV